VLLQVPLLNLFTTIEGRVHYLGVGVYELVLDQDVIDSRINKLVDGQEGRFDL
jgi:hypothetical protein